MDMPNEEIVKVARRYADEHYGSSLKGRAQSFIDGAKWAQEKFEKQLAEIRAERDIIKHDASPYSSRGYVTIDGRDFYAPELIETLKAENERLKVEIDRLEFKLEYGREPKPGE